MKILLPETIQDITLDQYQRFEKLNTKLQDEDITVLEYNKKKIALLGGIPYHDIDKVSHKGLEEVMEQIDTALSLETPFVQRFKLDGIEFGFIPNFDTITNAVYFDLNKYGVEVDTLHNLMAILFRPIVKESLNDYDIETYKGTGKYADAMKRVDMNTVRGAIVFFCNLSTELQNYIQKYTEAEQEKERKQETTLLNGVGIVH